MDMYSNGKSGCLHYTPNHSERNQMQKYWYIYMYLCLVVYSLFGPTEKIKNENLLYVGL